MIGKKEDSKLGSNEEEFAFLRENVSKQEQLVKGKGGTPVQQEIISNELKKYGKKLSEKILAASYGLGEKETETIALGLNPEEHDKTIMILLGIMKKKGIHNALSVVRRLKNPHIEDDFHRALVQYIKKNMKVKGARKRGPLWGVLNMTLYEVVLPENIAQSDAEKARSMREIISSMDQFYSGMISLSGKKGQNHFTVEIAISENSHEIIFYVSVPTNQKDLFEKHLLSVFPNAHLNEQKNDYNIFVDGGESKMSYARLKRDHALPLKMYEHFDYDPINIVLNALSKIEKEGGGAAIQLVFKPVADKYIKQYRGILIGMHSGRPLFEARKRGTENLLLRGFGDAILQIFRGPDDSGDKPIPGMVQVAIDEIQQKMSSNVIETNIRFVSSAKTKERASEILTQLESSFNQFHNTKGNELKFVRLTGKKLQRALYMFTYREFFKRRMIPLSVKELSTMLHFPGLGIKSSPQFKQLSAKTSPAPLDLPQEGTLLGVNSFRGIDTKVYLTKEDRLRHFYVIGQTGVGKTAMLKNMIIQDIRQGEGVCMIDPHGSDIVDVLGSIPQERYEDVIYFDPGYTKRSMGLNMLEYDPKYPEQKTFVINEMFNIFQKLYGAVPESMGPMFEQYFRNGTALVLEDPDSGSTLLDVSRVLSDAGYREYKLSKSNNPVVNQFWEKIAIRAGGEQALENIVPYITSKFDVFLANEIMRPVVGQEKSSFNFRDVMDNKKILLVNLSKGKLGDINSNLIGLVLVSKILMAALSRVDSDGTLPTFYLYIDEFQNITTNSIATILSEARKFNLSLTISHQFIKQLKEEIRDAVFGNVGSIASFRVGTEDAEFLEKQFKPSFTAGDLVNIQNWNAYIRLLAKGTPTKPFSMSTLPPIEGNKEIVEELRRYSYERYGLDREEVEKYILSKYIESDRPKEDDDDEYDDEEDEYEDS